MKRKILLLMLCFCLLFMLSGCEENMQESYTNTISSNLEENTDVITKYPDLISSAPTDIPTNIPKPTTTPIPIIEPTITPSSTDTNSNTYVLNVKSMKFHYSSCSSAKQIKDENRSEFTGTRDELLDKGYDPCQRCNP